MVHTDIWQVVIMFASVVVVAILATCYITDLDDFFESLVDGGRLIFGNINPSPYVRNTVWSVVIGGAFYWTSITAVHQTMVHRYMSLPNLKMARTSIAFFVLGSIIFYSVLSFLGLLIFNMYKDCDPLSAGQIMVGTRTVFQLLRTCVYNVFFFDMSRITISWCPSSWSRVSVTSMESQGFS